jgi:hypothetical protein
VIDGGCERECSSFFLLGIARRGFQSTLDLVHAGGVTFLVANLTRLVAAARIWDSVGACCKIVEWCEYNDIKKDFTMLLLFGSPDAKAVKPLVGVRWPFWQGMQLG